MTPGLLAKTSTFYTLPVVSYLSVSFISFLCQIKSLSLKEISFLRCPFFFFVLIPASIKARILKSNFGEGEISNSRHHYLIFSYLIAMLLIFALVKHIIFRFVDLFKIVECVH